MKKIKTLSKSKIMAYRQCPKRLWLEVHHRELRDDSVATEASFTVGHQVGEIARRIYDPANKGTVIDPQTDGFDAAFEQTLQLMQESKPIFEAGLRCDEGVIAFADVMLPIKRGNKKVWWLIEVKSAASVKDYHRDDAAVQAFIAKSSGVQIERIALAHIDSSWVYKGDSDYSGLLTEVDLTDEAFSKGEDVRTWVVDAHRIVKEKKEPVIATGKHCTTPYECGFLAHCQSSEPQAKYPITWLPGRKREFLRDMIEQRVWTEMRQAHDCMLNDQQQRVKECTLDNTVWFDKKAAAEALQNFKLPGYFLDFETVQHAIPIWKGTRPYQNVPFQFSSHRLSRTGKLTQDAFIDLSGNDPSLAFAKALIEACGNRGPIFVYNIGFESSQIISLAHRFPRLAKPLKAIEMRLVDLLPVVKSNYYHPSQQGSWSLKAVLPAMCPDLDYSNLDGVQDGRMAMQAYSEAIAPETAADRKAEIEQQLLDYCALDTFAMVRIWSVLAGTPVSQHG